MVGLELYLLLYLNGSFLEYYFIFCVGIVNIYGRWVSGVVVELLDGSIIF